MSQTVRQRYDALVAEGTLRPDPAQVAAIGALDDLRAALEAPAPRRFFSRKQETVPGVYLWGGVGRGKSMLMDLFVETLTVPVRRVHFHAFMQSVHDAMHLARQRGVTDAVAPVAKEIASGLRCLAFDEMQITDITDAMIVGRLFEQLVSAGVTIVTTSNRVPDDLYKNGLNRQLFLPFIAFMHQTMTVIELSSPTDYRQGRLAGSERYLTPAGPEARAAMTAIWDDLTGGAAPVAHSLRLKGREVEIPAFANGVGRASFHDLCARPLGPADYLAITEAVRVLMVDDIPLLSRSNFNEAKRFVTMIDTVYEAGIGFICSAATRPEMLYVEGEGTFEFERTASRLREMMSADWGA